MEQKKEESKDKMEIENETNQPENIKYSIKIGDVNYDQSLELAEKYKQEGNEVFQKNQFLQALEKYNEAINLKVETKKNAVLFK